MEIKFEKRIEDTANNTTFYADKENKSLITVYNGINLAVINIKDSWIKRAFNRICEFVGVRGCDQCGFIDMGGKRHFSCLRMATIIEVNVRSSQRQTDDTKMDTKIAIERKEDAAHMLNQWRIHGPDFVRGWLEHRAKNEVME